MKVVYHCLVIYLVSSTDQIYHLAALRLGDKFDRSMTLSKLLDNNAQLFIFFLNNVIRGIIQICKIFAYISGEASRRKVGGGTKKKERKSCIESGVRGRLGALPQKCFTE